MIAHFTMRMYGVNQEFRFVEDIWLHRKSCQIRGKKKSKKTYFTSYACNMFRATFLNNYHDHQGFLLCEYFYLTFPFLFFILFIHVFMFDCLSICSICPLNSFVPGPFLSSDILNAEFVCKSLLNNSETYLQLANVDNKKTKLKSMNIYLC